jgi:hypothetical protein
MTAVLASSLDATRLVETVTVLGRFARANWLKAVAQEGRRIPH